jgi:hypothetical protein
MQNYEYLGLMPCPLCGEEVKVWNNKRDNPRIYCKSCKGRISSRGKHSREIIISSIESFSKNGKEIKDYLKNYKRGA